MCAKPTALIQLPERPLWRAVGCLTKDRRYTSDLKTAHFRHDVSGKYYDGISGVLVRLTTCKRLTNSLPKLSLITFFPLKRRDNRSAGYTSGPVNIQAVSFPGDTRESIFQVRHGESLKEFVVVDGGI